MDRFLDVLLFFLKYIFFFVLLTKRSIFMKNNLKFSIFGECAGKTFLIDARKNFCKQVFTK